MELWRQKARRAAASPTNQPVNHFGQLFDHQFGGPMGCCWQGQRRRRVEIGGIELLGIVCEGSWKVGLDDIGSGGDRGNAHKL
jgi:hypothetical protein